MFSRNFKDIFNLLYAIYLGGGGTHPAALKLTSKIPLSLREQLFNFIKQFIIMQKNTLKGPFILLTYPVSLSHMHMPTLKISI